jgi:hypothetical protein
VKTYGFHFGADARIRYGPRRIAEVADAPKSEISGKPGLALDPFHRILAVVLLVKERSESALRSLRASAALNNHLHPALREQRGENFE